LAISPDGSKLLVMRQLQPRGIPVSCRIPPCPQPPTTPATGNLLELRSAGTLRPIWSLRATASQFWHPSSAPVISPDGRYAVVMLPPRDDRQLIGLVSMANGRLRQTLGVGHVGGRPQSFGFSPDSRGVWLAYGGILVNYRMRHH
jgi:hypothetical protein